MKYATHSGLIVEAPTFGGIVRQLKQMSWDVEPKRDYMLTVGERMRAIGRPVDTTSVRAFVRSLVLHGYLTPVKD